MKYAISKMKDSNDEYQLIATEKINAGEVFIKERPLVFVNNIEKEHELLFPWRLTEEILANQEIREKYFRWGVRVTHSPFFNFMLAYEKHLSEKYGLPSSSVRGVYFSVTTNNIGFCDVHGNTSGWAMYKHMIRANHSCAPNAAPLLSFSQEDVTN